MYKLTPTKKYIALVALIIFIIFVIFSIKIYHYNSHAHQREMVNLTNIIQNLSHTVEFAMLENGQVEYFSVPFDTPYLSRLASYLPYTVPSKRIYSSEHDWLYSITIIHEAQTIVLMINEQGLMNVNGKYIVMADEHWVDMCYKFEVAYLYLRNDYASEILTCPVEEYFCPYVGTAAKGQYIRSCTVAATMGPGVKVNSAKYI